MSNPVTSTSVGKYFRSSGVSSGQPSVPIGQRPDENHVSRTSWSRTSGAPPASREASSSVAAQCWRPSESYQTGIWWPHQSWREMHHGSMFSSQLK